MTVDEKSGYKSWGNLKKQMNELLSDSLKDKISYCYTTYRRVHDTYGRATINFEKRELAAFSWHMRYEQWDDEHKILNDSNSDICHLGSLPQVWEKQKQIQKELSREKWMPECILCDGDFINAVTSYLKTDISSALNSDNYIMRVFAYMDRRLGKRTLLKIRDDAEVMPDWVKQFYHIRCQAEGLEF